MRLKRLVEGFGAIMMDPDPAENIMQPDIKRANAMMFFAGTSGTIPAHWNDSPFLTGGRMTSAFGANPIVGKKNKVLSYSDFVGISKGFNKSK